MKKLAGLLAFAVALACAILITQYYTKKPAPPPPPAQPAAPAAPTSVWVWAYFFTHESPGKYCEGGPVEVKRPFDAGARATVTVGFPVTNCPAPRTPSTTFYARFNVSTESSFAARL